VNCYCEFSLLRLVFVFGIAVFAPRASYFFSAAKKSNQKKPSLLDCPERSARGSWIYQHCLRAHPDVPSRHTGLISPSLAKLLYQYRWIQQSKEEVLTGKNKTHQLKQKYILKYMHRMFNCFRLWLSVRLSKPLRRCHCHEFSVKTVWAFSASFFTAWQLYWLNGNPCAFYRGARRSDGFFWLLFLADEKKWLAVKRRNSQCKSTYLSSVKKNSRNKFPLLLAYTEIMVRIPQSLMKRMW